MAYTAGIIGYGERGATLARVIREHVPDIELVAAADTSLDRRAEAAANGLDAFIGMEGLLATVRPNIVIIATNPPQHCEQVLMAADRGCHIFCGSRLLSRRRKPTA